MKKNVLKNEMKFLLSFIFLLSIICNVSFAYDLRIIDGDTIELNGDRIRFAGIDTPEPKQICTLDNIEIFCGNLATVVLKEKIENEENKKKYMKNMKIQIICLKMFIK